VSIDIQLEAEEQPYSIIPCTFLPNQLNTFSLAVSPHNEAANDEIQLKPCSESYWKECRVSVRVHLCFFDGVSPRFMFVLEIHPPLSAHRECGAGPLQGDAGTIERGSTTHSFPPI